MPAAQGVLLGSIDSSGLFGTPWSKAIDFVGLYGYKREIRSARIYGLGEDEYFAVEGYAVTLVEDSTPPDISDAFADPPMLWPPDNQLRPVEIAVRATDFSGIDYCRIISVFADEPVSTDDWAITGDLSLLLRAKRDGHDADRTYSVLIECSDVIGNKSWRIATVTVPHDQRFRRNRPSSGSTRGQER